MALATAGTAQVIHLQLRIMMSTALETGIAQNGMEITALNGDAQHFHKAQQHIMTNTAQNGTAAHGMLEKKCA